MLRKKEDQKKTQKKTSAEKLKELEDLKKAIAQKEEEVTELEDEVEEAEEEEEVPDIEPKEKEEKVEEQKYVQVPIFLNSADKDKMIYETHLMMSQLLKSLESSEK